MCCAVLCHRDEYRNCCDLLVGLPGLHVVGVELDDGGGLRARVESTPTWLPGVRGRRLTS